VPEPSAADWGDRYLQRLTPWDLGRAHPELVSRIESLGPPGRAVVPGAGYGHDARALADAGWRVTAIEFVPDLERDLGEAVGWAGDVVIGDALQWTPREPVDLVFDHTFFCAIPLRRRPEFGPWAESVLREGGTVASAVFPIGRSPRGGGPPFAMSAFDLADALGPRFDLVTETEARQPRGRSWPTRWAEFVRMPDSFVSPTGLRYLADAAATRSRPGRRWP